MNVQPGVIDSPQEHLDLVCLHATPKRGATLRSALQRLSEEATRLMEQHVASGLTVTIGFGSAFVDTCSATQRPKALRAMPRFKGDEYDPTEAQADLVLQICSNLKFANHIAGRCAGFYRWHGQPGQRGPAPRGAHRRHRPLLQGRVVHGVPQDPRGRARLGQALAQGTGGRRRPSQGRQCGGSRRADDIWSPFESGLLFICYQADVDQYEAIKKSMLGVARGGHDRLEDFYHTVEGGYYFMPPRPKNKDEFIGDFLFR